MTPHIGSGHPAIFPKGVELIKTDAYRWRQYPRDLRLRIQDGVARIARWRHAMASEAKVPFMPSIRVFDKICGEGFLHVAAIQGFMRIHGWDFPVVNVMAPLAVCEDEDLVRGVLAHEVSHCFWWLAALIDADDAGIPEVKDDGNPFDEADDARLQVDPSKWFGPDDARRYATWNDARFAILETIGHELEAHLLVEKPVKTPFVVTNPYLPDEVVAHVRQLRGGGP